MVHASRVRCKPLRDGARQNGAEPGFAGGRALANFISHLQHALMVVHVAFGRRKRHFFHPALLLAEMRFGVGDELVEHGKHLRLRRIGQAVQQLYELSMGLIHDAPVERQGFVPFHDRHGHSPG